MAQIVTNDPDYFLNNQAQGSFNDQSRDASGLGIYPAAEQNNTYFAYFNAATSTEPEILGKSAIYINYLIDSEGNLTNPKPGDIALYNLKNTFSQGSTMFITPEDPSQVYSPLIGENPIENIGTVQLVLTSETGKSPSNFLNDIKIATKPRYNQQFTLDYSTAQAIYRTGSFEIDSYLNNIGGVLGILARSTGMVSSYIFGSSVNPFTSSFQPLYSSQSLSSGIASPESYAKTGSLFYFPVGVSGSANDTGSQLNMSWNEVNGEWTFINTDSPYDLNIQLTADFRLDISAFIDPTFSGSQPVNFLSPAETYSWCLAPWGYSIEAKFQLYSDATSTWDDIDIDVNASRFTPNYGTKVYNTAGVGHPPNKSNVLYGLIYETQNIESSQYLTKNYNAFYDVDGNLIPSNASFAKKIRVSGFAVAPASSGPYYTPMDASNNSPSTANATAFNFKRVYWVYNSSIQKYVHNPSIYGDQYIYIKSAPFAPKFNDKFRVVIKITPALEGPGNQNDLNQNYNSQYQFFANEIDFPPIWFVFKNYTNFSSFISTNQNYDPSLTIPADGVIPVISNPDSFASASYWVTGSIPNLADNSLMWLTASQALSNKILDPQNYYQNFYEDNNTLTNLGYNNPVTPIDPLPGDYIRFEYDVDKQYRILATDRENLTGFAIGVFPPIPSNANFNHFTISRVIDDGNYIIISTEYPASGSITDNLTGFAKPKYVTQVLESEFTKITTDLVKSGVLKNQV
jgi:hypothetical protein